MQPTDIRRELAVQAAIKTHMDAIVHAATEAATLLEGGNMDKSQIRNVLNVAEESESIAVVTNFIRYQIGRSGTGCDWQHGGFGLRVIQDLTEEDGPVLRTVEGVAERVAGELDQGEIGADLRRQIHVELMLRYLGYLNRAFIFGGSDFKDSWQELKRATREATHV